MTVRCSLDREAGQRHGWSIYKTNDGAATFAGKWKAGRLVWSVRLLAEHEVERSEETVNAIRLCWRVAKEARRVADIALDAVDRMLDPDGEMQVEFRTPQAMHSHPHDATGRAENVCCAEPAGRGAEPGDGGRERSRGGRAQGACPEAGASDGAIGRPWPPAAALPAAEYEPPPSPRRAAAADRGLTAAT